MLKHTPKHLFVGTVLHQFENWERLYEIQTFFLAKTTTNYTLVVTSEEKPNFIKNCVWLPKPKFSPEHGSVNHIRGLNVLYKYFLQQHNSHFLFLDSDAFPIQVGWHKKLLNILTLYNKTYAAPIRFETLNLFPHPSVVFIKDQWLRLIGDNLRANINPIYKKHDGPVIRVNVDTGCKLPIEPLFPLLRSNVVMIHPILYAIYYNMFYHHGCGSRAIFHTAAPYWEKSQVKTEYSDELFVNPEQFINKLNGNE